MLLDPEGEVPQLIELAGLQRVARSFEGQHQEILCRFSSEGQLGSDWLILLYCESGQGLLGYGPHRALVSDLLEDGLSVNQPLTALAHTDVNYHLVYPGLLHNVHLTAPRPMAG